MFGFLKKKLKDTISGISKKIEEEGEETEADEQPEEIKEEIKKEPGTKEEQPIEKEEIKQEKKSFFIRLKDKFVRKKEIPKEEEFEEVSVKSEVEELKKEEEIRKAEQKKQEAEKKVAEKIEKKATPSIQELGERKGIGELKEEIKKIKEEIEEEKKEPKKEDVERIKEEVRDIEEEVKDRKGFFGKLKEKIVTKKINEKQFDDLFWNLEVALLENNVAVEVIEKIKQDLKSNLVDKPIRRNKIEETVSLNLKKSIEDLFDTEKINLFEKIKQKKPYVICFVGINGSGKTTTIAKMAQLLKNNNLSSVLVASDTFRAASIEQLQKHADNLQVKLIKHDYGSDPAAVAFDAIKYAKSKSIDVVLIDTAGRIQSNVNLIDEMKKIIRVANPDLKIFVGESITGNDCVEQAQKFDEAIGIDAIILAKADIDEKGGAAISVSYVTKKPIIYLGIGQEYGDLKEFDSELIVNSLGLEG